MTCLYLVIQIGVYRHDIRGIYTSEAAAAAAAKRAATEDRDSYHDYQVHEATLDEYVDDVRPIGPVFEKDKPNGRTDR